MFALILAAKSRLFRFSSLRGSGICASAAASVRPSLDESLLPSAGAGFVVVLLLTAQVKSEVLAAADAERSAELLTAEEADDEVVVEEAAVAEA